MKKIICIFMLFTLISCDASAQLKSNAFGFQVGYQWRSFNSIVAGVNYLKGGEVDKEKSKHIGMYTYGPFLNISLNFTDNVTLGQNIGMTGSICNNNLFGFTSIVCIEHFKKQDFRISFGAGISFWEILRINYSHSFPMNNYYNDQIGNDIFNLTLVLNRIPFDILFSPIDRH